MCEVKEDVARRDRAASSELPMLHRFERRSVAAESKRFAHRCLDDVAVLRDDDVNAGDSANARFDHDWRKRGQWAGKRSREESLRSRAGRRVDARRRKNLALLIEQSCSGYVDTTRCSTLVNADRDELASLAVLLELEIEVRRKIVREPPDVVVLEHIVRLQSAGAA